MVEDRAPDQVICAARQIGLGVALVAIACAESREPAGEERVAGQSCAEGQVITGSGVGPVMLGLQVAELREVCAGRDTTISLEGMDEHVFSVPLDSGGSILAILDGGGVVSRLTITGGGPATLEGVGAGSTVVQVAAAYPDACLMPGEGRMVVIAPGTGVSFQTGAPVGAPHTTLDTLQDTTTIAAVFVHGEEAECP